MRAGAEAAAVVEVRSDGARVERDRRDPRHQLAVAGRHLAFGDHLQLGQLAHAGVAAAAAQHRAARERAGALLLDLAQRFQRGLRTGGRGWRVGIGQPWQARLRAQRRLGRCRDAGRVRLRGHPFGLLLRRLVRLRLRPGSGRAPCLGGACRGAGGAGGSRVVRRRRHHQSRGHRRRSARGLRNIRLSRCRAGGLPRCHPRHGRVLRGRPCRRQRRRLPLARQPDEGIGRHAVETAAGLHAGAGNARAAAFGRDRGAEVLRGSGILALGLVQAAGRGQHLRGIRCLLQGRLQGTLGPAVFLGGRGGTDGGQPQVEVARLPGQHAFIKRERLVVLAGLRVHARQAGPHRRVAAALGECRGEGVVGGDQVARRGQRVGLPDDIGDADIVVAAPLLGRHAGTGELAQQAGQFHVLLRLEQHRGVLELHAGIGHHRAAHRIAHQRQCPRGVARIRVALCDRPRQFRILSGKALGLLQHADGGGLLAGSGQLTGARGFGVDPQASLELAHVGAAPVGGHALEQVQATLPFVRFGGGQRAGVQRFGIARHGQQQVVHDAAGLVLHAHGDIQARDLQPHPRVGRVCSHRIFKHPARAGRIALLHGLACLGAGLVGTQPAERGKLPAPGRRHALDQRQCLGGLVLRLEHLDQPARGGGALGVRAQHAAVGRLGRGVLPRIGLQIGQCHLRGGLIRLDALRLLEQAACLGGVASLAPGGGALNQQPVIGAVAGLAVAAAGAVALRAREVVRSLRELFLPEPQHAHAAERIGIVGLLRECALETLAGKCQVAGVQCRKTLLHDAAHRVCARRAGLAGSGRLARCGFQPGADGAVFRMRCQPRLVERGVRGALAEPAQRAAPAFGGVLADIGAAGQAFQLADPVAPGVVAVRQVLRQCQLRADIGRIGARQALQPLPCGIPALRGAAQGLVILQREVALRHVAAGGFFIAFDGLLGLPAARELARLLDLLPCAGAAAARDLLAQLPGQRGAWRRLLQAIQVGARRIRPSGLQLGNAHAVQRVGLRRVQAQQLLPHLGRPVRPAARLPVLALLDERLDGIFLRRGGRGGPDTPGQQRQHQRMPAQAQAGGLASPLHCRAHALSPLLPCNHRSSSCPEGTK
ncbi:hypothetical protein D9M68_420440 [compost metagenome]